MPEHEPGEAGWAAARMAPSGAADRRVTRYVAHGNQRRGGRLMPLRMRVGPRAGNPGRPPSGGGAGGVREPPRSATGEGGDDGCERLGVTDDDVGHAEEAAVPLELVHDLLHRPGEHEGRAG